VLLTQKFYINYLSCVILDLCKEKKDKEAMKHQSESLIAEYDRLRKENIALTAGAEDSKDK
jgi:hypothetical protein